MRTLCTAVPMFPQHNNCRASARLAVVEPSLLLGGHSCNSMPTTAASLCVADVAIELAAMCV
eukprot:1568599-Amphidinium_carterae.1